MASVIIFVCAIVSIFFPAMVYVPSVLICVMASSLFGVKLGYGASAISYFGALPFVGMIFFLFLPKPVKLRVSFIFTDNSLVEYLGLMLIVKSPPAKPGAYQLSASKALKTWSRPRRLHA